ncbi:MAG: DUF903 domain-containing protein [Gammaproteobacteria bacterium]|nr:DUF903 domain-containing protein [Gammaproteobacteria bacterium]
MKKTLVSIFLISSALSGCTNYFSDYNTVYRIETTDGQRYYSDSKPDLNESQGIYEIEDLDNNEYRIKKELIYKIEKYKHRK